MSADNGYIIRQNRNKKYVLQMYFASTILPRTDEEGGFDTLEEACRRYAEISAEPGFICEYGLTIAVPPIKEML